MDDERVDEPVTGEVFDAEDAAPFDEPLPFGDREGGGAEATEDAAPFDGHSVFGDVEWPPAGAADSTFPFHEEPPWGATEPSPAEEQGGNGGQALRQLADLFPEEDRLRDMEVRAALRSTFSVADSIPVRHSTPGALLRTMLLFLVTIAVCLSAAAGFTLAYYKWVKPPQEERQQELYINGLKQDVDVRMTAGDYIGAREKVDALATALPPGSAEVAAAYIVLEEQESLARLYDSGLQKEVDGELEEALEIFRQVEARSPGYSRVRQHIAQVERAMVLEGDWQEAQDVIATGDWQAAVTLLTEMRRTSPGFHRAEVDGYLFTVYSQLGTQLLGEAGGNVGQVEQAIDYLDQALALRPAARDLGEERRLARWYVAGAKAYAEENWTSAVKSWEQVYRVRADYQGGVVRSYLYQAYPKAADELVATAEGEAKPLKQAVTYYDQVPNPDASIVEERSLASEYLAGLDAFNAAHWDEAIVHWGPVYLLRPSYQNGALDEKLRVACVATEIEYDTWCPP